MVNYLKMEKYVKRVFIDLEETIINDIDAAKPLWDNILKIKKFIADESPDSIETFSFALWTEQDKANWDFAKRKISLPIETQTFEVNVLKLAFLRAMVGHVKPHEMTDFLALMTKDRVFEWMIQKDFTEGEFILIDDLVESHTLITKKGKMIIRIININDL